MSSSFSSSPPLTKLLCQRVVFRNILSANNLQRLHQEMLSIHVLSFLFFCLFVRPSACLAVFLYFMLLLFQKWYLITKLPYYLRKGDLKLRKTVEIPNCDTNCGNSISVAFLVVFLVMFKVYSISSTISNSIASSFSSSPPLTKLLCPRVVFSNILSEIIRKDCRRKCYQYMCCLFCFSVSLSVRLPVSLYFLFCMLLLFQEWYLIAKLPHYLRKGDLIAKNCGNT